MPWVQSSVPLSQAGPESLIFDPGDTQLEIGTGADGFWEVSFSAPTPPRKRVEATSQDTEGSLLVASQYDNRTITIVTRAKKSASRTAWYYKLDQLQQVIGKVNDEGAVLKRTAIGSARPHYFDLVDGGGDIDWSSLRYALNMDVDITLTFLALPFAREDEVTFTNHAETTLPCIVFSEGTIRGDVPSIGRLVIDNDVAPDQNLLYWGIDYLDSATTSMWFYEAEALTPLDASTKVDTNNGGSTADGVYDAIHCPGLPAGNQWCPVMSTDITGVGKMTHKGSYRVLARCFSTTPGQVRFLWGMGDFVSTVPNPATDIWAQNNWILLDLGVIRLGDSVQWAGVLQALTNSATFEMWVDYYILIPIDKASGKIESVQTHSPLSINTQRRPATTSDLNDFSSPWTRDFGDSNIVNTTVLPGGSSNTYQMKAFGFNIPVGATIAGMQFGFYHSNSYDIEEAVLQLLKAGVLAGSNRARTNQSWNPVWAWDTVGDEDDLWGTTWTPAQINSPDFGINLRVTTHSQIAAGASIAWMQLTVYYSVASPFTAAKDAAMFGYQSCQIADTGVTRESSDGTLWVPKSSNYEGDLLRVPPSRLEGRGCRVIVKASRQSQLQNKTDTAIDNISARLHLAARWLTVPDG